jgi:hypothetical protein
MLIGQLLDGYFVWFFSFGGHPKISITVSVAHSGVPQEQISKLGKWFI